MVGNSSNVYSIEEAREKREAGKRMQPTDVGKVDFFSSSKARQKKRKAAEDRAKINRRVLQGLGKGK